MKLHLLEIQAFGPFAATASVDFDRLSAAGLFLLSGPTGAGKTSVLDAVCFALYGDVPGDRGSAKRLRADQAAPGLNPRVSLEATLQGRRFRFVRSPQWERAKKRGAGTTTEQASVVVSEKMGRDWVVLATRLDEAGYLVGSLVGMTMTQFTQVAMLPQGRFQTFLRSRSEDRHRLLQQLFRTGRFEDVERWLREHRLELRRRTETSHQAVADAVSRVSEAAGQPIEPEWDLHDLTVPLTGGDVGRWVDVRVDRAQVEAGVAEADLALAVHAESEARSALETARTLAERRERRRRASAERDTLQERATEHAEAVAALDLGRRAAPVLPQVRAADQAADRVASAARQWEIARGVLPAPSDGADHPSVALGHRRSQEHVAVTRALLPRGAELIRLVGGLAELTHEIAGLDAELTRHDVLVAALPARRQTAETRLHEAEDADRDLLLLAPQRDRAAARLDARRLADTVTLEVSSARAELQQTHEWCMSVRESWLAAREARLNAMAAEIAGALVVGDSCPVCGSCDHPHKAVIAGGPTGAVLEQEARRRLDDAEIADYAHQGRVRDLEQQLAAALTAAEHRPLAELTAELTELDARVTTARTGAAAVGTCRADLTALTDQADALTRDRSAAEVALAASTSRRTAQQERVTAMQAEIDAVLTGSGHDTVDGLVAAAEQTQRQWRDAARALDDLAECERAAKGADRLLADLLDQAGLPGRAAALAAALSPQEMVGLEQQTATYERRVAGLDILLAELGADLEEPDDPAGPDDPPVDALARAHIEAEAAAAQARGVSARAEARSRRLTELQRVLTRTVADWVPLAADLQLSTRLSAFAEGKGADNLWQMRLSAYVLAHRLGQVVAAANQRLSAMSDQRYALEHTARRGAGETRGGLSLLVRDDWSGESRDPATLSGGETFVVSLALALGLADVIAHEAGGADLETLFVDEGFGSLDADTLDDVMDVLDTLRDGGRVVGVVSHVSEMRDRIPTRLLVTKSRAGSTLAQVP